MAVILAASLSNAPAFAYTQCTGTISSIWAGDGGNVWLHLKDSGSAIIAPNDPNREAVLAMAMTALTASRQVIIRYTANNADCSAFGRTDFVGMYLL